MTFSWNCCKKDLEKRSILEDILPTNYNYKVSSFKLTETSDIKNESKFEAVLSVNICSEVTTKEFLKEFEKSSSTVYNMYYGDQRDHGKTAVSGFRKCYHNVRKRIKSGKKASNEAVAEPKTAGKDTSCPADIKFKLKKTVEHLHNENCYIFPLEITINYNHNHCIESANAVKYHDVNEETKMKFTELFENDHSASSAYQEYKNHLLKKHGENFVTVSADRAIMPDYKWVFNYHAIFTEKCFGKINSPEAYEKAVKKVKEYNEKNDANLCSIEQTDDGEIIVAVCDSLSRRVHKVLPQAGDVVYVDATSNLGRKQY